jgi:hypothetical protein
MNKPRILVLTAAGKTGMPVALQLLDEGFPVTAFVHKADQRSERLKAKGANIVVGSLTDINDIKNSDGRCQACLLLCSKRGRYAQSGSHLYRDRGFAKIGSRRRHEPVAVQSQSPFRTHSRGQKDTQERRIAPLVQSCCLRKTHEVRNEKLKSLS